MTLLFMLCFTTTFAQNTWKEAVVSRRLTTQFPDGASSTTIDTLLVQKGFILEPVKLNYSNSESNLSTGDSKISSKIISAGKRLKWYYLTNFQEMIGMAFDIESTPSSKTIEPYEFSPPSKLKRGQNFVLEPYLTNGVDITDYSKDKDTIIDGQKCFLIKGKNVTSTNHKGKKMEVPINFRLGINPTLKSHALPFISEKIVEHFGGGAIVFLDGTTKNGIRGTVHYTYADFTPVDKKLFDYYKAMYDSNILLLDRFKKRK